MGVIIKLMTDSKLLPDRTPVFRPGCDYSWALSEQTCDRSAAVLALWGVDQCTLGDPVSIRCLSHSRDQLRPVIQLPII